MVYRNPEDEFRRGSARPRVPIPIPKRRPQKQEPDRTGQLLQAGLGLLGDIAKGGIQYTVQSKLGEERAALTAKESALPRTYLTGARVAGQEFATGERVAGQEHARGESMRERISRYKELRMKDRTATAQEILRINAGLALEDLSQKNRLALEALKEFYRKEAARRRRNAARKGGRRGDWLLHEGKLYNKNELKSNRDFYMGAHKTIANVEYGKEGRQTAYDLQYILDVAQNVGGWSAAKKANNGVSPVHNAVFGGVAQTPPTGGTELTSAEIAQIEREAGAGRSDELTPAEIAQIEREATAGLDSPLQVKGERLPPSQSQRIAQISAERAARTEHRTVSGKVQTAEVASLRAKLDGVEALLDTETSIANSELRDPLKGIGDVVAAQKLVRERLATARPNGPPLSINELNDKASRIREEITKLTGERVVTVRGEAGALPATTRRREGRAPPTRDLDMLDKAKRKAQAGTLTTDDWKVAKMVAEDTGSVFDVEDPKR